MVGSIEKPILGRARGLKGMSLGRGKWMQQHQCAGAVCPYCSPCGFAQTTTGRNAKWAPSVYYIEAIEETYYGRDSTGALVTQHPKRLAVGATIILIIGTMDNRVVLCQKRRDNEQWAFPGGKQEIGESLTACAIREMQEETGLEIEICGVTSIDSDPQYYAISTYPDGAVQYTNITFLAQLADAYPPGVIPYVQPCEESLELRWCPLYRLPEPFLLNHRWRLEQALRHRGPFLPVR